MKEFPARVMSRRWFLYLTVLGPVGFGVATTLGCEDGKSETIIEGFDYWFADQLLKITNEERIERDLPPFIQHSGLIEAAKEHAQEMAQNNFIAHQSLDGSTHIDRIVRKGFSPNLLIKENGIRGAIGESMTDRPFMYFKDFMNSKKGHRENMLNPKLKLVGIGCYVQNPTRWCVIVFVGAP